MGTSLHQEPCFCAGFFPGVAAGAGLSPCVLGISAEKTPQPVFNIEGKATESGLSPYAGGVFSGVDCGMAGTLLCHDDGSSDGYLMGVILLTVLNKGFHIKASGHACSCVMAYLLLGEWLGLGVFFICVPLYLGEFWASVSLKRHTVKEFIGGTGVAVFAFLAQKFLYLM